MKTKVNLLQARLWSGWLGMLCVVFPGQGNEPATTPTPAGPPAKLTEAIPWSQVANKAGANYQGEGLAVTATAEGARLRCVFQKLDGEATSEGLWLTSNVSNGVNDRFRVVAAAVGRSGLRQSSAALAAQPSCSKRQSIAAVQGARALQRTGTVEVAGNLVRFVRPGLVEEYSVSMDGVRQDFVVLERPPSPLNGERAGVRGEAVHELLPRTEARKDDGTLRLELAVTGARVEPIAGGVHPVRYGGQAVDHERGNMLSHGARLVLEKSGRKIAYGRLRVTDATGKELSARMEVMGSARVPRAGSGVAAEPLSKADCVDGGFRRDAENHTPEAYAPQLALLVDDAQAVYPIRIDPTFSDANWISMNPSIPGANWEVYAAVVDGSGNLYISGYFTVVSDVIANRIAKWNGSGWSALGSGITNGYVYALAVSGSDVCAGGAFTTAGGKVWAYLARAVLGDALGYNQLTSTLLSGNAMQFSYIGYPATNYALDRAFDLSPPVSWVGQETNTMTVSGVLQFTNTPAPGTNNFWRVRSVP